jgi:hypothetical protein
MSVGNPEKPGGTLRANDSGICQIVDAMPVLVCTLTAQFEVELRYSVITRLFRRAAGRTEELGLNWCGPSRRS